MPKKTKKNEAMKEYSEKVLLREGTIELTNPKLEVFIGKDPEGDKIIVSRNGEVIGGITDIIIKISRKEQSVTVKGVSKSAFLDKATSAAEDEDDVFDEGGEE